MLKQLQKQKCNACKEELPRYRIIEPDDLSICKPCYNSKGEVDDPRGKRVLFVLALAAVVIGIVSIYSNVSTYLGNG